MEATEKIEGSKHQFKLHNETRYTKIYSHPVSQSLIIQVVNNFIPIDEFKKNFYACSEIIKAENLKKVIFDKRKMSVFHQPSMEWYFLEWKEEIADKYGVNTHRKILPDDNLFIQSVKIARKKIDENYPNARYKQLDIQYVNSIDEAIEL